MPLDLNAQEVDALVRILEESTRAAPHTVQRFVEPARGTLDRAKSQRHHIVFGRRGSGKTSLLRKAVADLAVSRTPTAFVDLEAFKGHAYPDVLLSVLIATVHSFLGWLQEEGSRPRNSLLFWRRVAGATPERPPLPKKQREAIAGDLRKLKNELEQLLFAQDLARINTTVSTKTQVESEAQVSLKAGVRGLGGGISAREELTASAGIEQTEEAQRSKVDFLHRCIMRFQQLFNSIAQVGGQRAFLVLDDLYHIRRSDQAAVLDYFHRIAKNSGVWLKVGSIRHRTDHYRHSDPPMGMKLGDDADEIDLDITLEKYELAKDFLVRLLKGIFQDAGVKDLDEILVPSAVERLVLASGGVARDFLTITRRAIDCARERGDDIRGPRVGAEDVNRAAGEHDTSKRDELRRDTADDTSRIEEAFSIIRDFCLKQANSNCFLVERDSYPECRFVVDELVDLKMLHLVNSRITIPDRAGHFFVAYMLDLSQYAGDRKRRNLDLIPFWDASSRDRLRRVSIVLDLKTLEPIIGDGRQP